MRSGPHGSPPVSRPTDPTDELAHEEETSEEAAPASRRRLVGVLCLVAATLVWTAAASAFLRTGQVRVSLVALGLVFAVLPLVTRGGEDASSTRDDEPPPR